MHGLSDALHVPLKRKKGLRRAEAAKRTVRRSIRGHSLGTDADTGPVVRTTGMNGAARKDNRRQGLIGAAINGEIDFTAQNLSIAAYRGAVTSPRRMALGGGRHILHAVIND